jgi:hypothetical protein
MNKDLVGFHIREANEELQRTVDEISKDPEYGEGELLLAMQHIYHHLNTAWNARDASHAEADPGTDEQFNRWGQFPADLPLMEVE